ncbi:MULTISPECIES: hypothetical protein [unclassified Streptomyces]|uniref:hypothetical protein n=1 Tax=unclassified Streptomyces TaxID=2593676 RepID=UPI0015F8E31A|nr:hypothetical protein [Streptomyces sp. GMR22]MBA6434367.1 hypothetical protein [Streptomyces sp. GMR22]MBI0378198.1 hypothetical protein [Streptomyces albiflaviniger]
MNRNLVTAAASVGVLVAASTVSLAGADPASAETADCVQIGLQGNHINPTPERMRACYRGGHFSGWGDKQIAYQTCWAMLVRTHVSDRHADEACWWAQYEQ